MDHTEAEVALGQRVVALAVAAAGPNTDATWRMRVGDNIPLVAAMLRAESDQVRHAVQMMSAQPFRSLYTSHQLEESTKRYIVSMWDPKAEKDESIRTDFASSPNGRRAKAVLDSLVEGQPILVFKIQEEMQGRGGKTARIAVHLEPAGRAPESAAGRPPQRSSSAGNPVDDAPPPAGIPSPAEEEGPSHGNTQRVTEALRPLTAKMRVDVARACREAGITNFMDPSDDELDRVLDHIKESLDAF